MAAGVAWEAVEGNGGMKKSNCKLQTAKCKIQLSHMECGSRAAAFLVSDLFFQPLQREACRFDPIPHTFNHTPKRKHSDFLMERMR